MVEPTVDKKELLRANYLFKDLDPEVIDRLISLAVTRKLGKDEALFFKGDEGDALYGVLSGKVRISTGSPSGREIVLSIMEPGDVFGEIALLDGMNRTADATGLEAGELMMIRRRDFLPFLESEPSIAIHLLTLVCGRLRTNNERIEDIAFLDLPARLAKYLLALAQSEEARGGRRADGQVEIRVSQSDLGSFLGTSRESVNKHLQVWKRNGWIDLGRSKVFVVEPDALEDVVEAGLFG